MKEQLESLVGTMVERGILLEEASRRNLREEVLSSACWKHIERGNQCRAAKILGIHRNTLSRKVDEYIGPRRTPRVSDQPKSDKLQ